MLDKPAVGHEIIAMGGNFRFKGADDAKARHELLTNDIHIMNQQIVAETAGQDDHGGAESIMLLENRLRRKHPRADGGDTAEAVCQSF